jgi:FkbM family methyltransferase
MRGLAWRILAKTDNLGNSDFTTNGESVLLDNLQRYWQDKRISDKLCFFDIGANKGEYTDILLNTTTQMTVVGGYLFEAQSSLCKMLTDKYKDRGYITIINKAVNDTDGEKLSLYKDEEGSGHASLYNRNLEYYGERLDIQEAVETMRLDAFIMSEDIKHINLLKIDIECNELKAWQGMGKYLDANFVDFIQFEYGGANLDSHSSLMEIYALLVSRGFKIARIMPKGLLMLDYNPHMDNFVFCNYVAVSGKLL